MRRHVSVITYTFAFLATLEFPVFFPDWYGASFFFLAGVLLFLQRPVVGGFSEKSVLPFFFGFSSWLLLFFIDSTMQRHIFSVLSGCLFFWMLWSFRRWRGGALLGVTKSGIASVTIATVFLFFSVLSGTLINYTFSIWIFALLSGVGVYLLTYPYLFGVTGDKKRSISYSLAISIFFGQLGWIIQFWPFGYLTIGVILLIFYYILWDFVGNYVEGTFTRSRVWGNLSLLIFLTVLVLGTTRWVPIG